MSCWPSRAAPGPTINVPAISESGVPDALDREPGVAMVSALGRTAEGFAEIKRAVGQRAWAALYLGVPAAPEGGLIQRLWLDDWRLPAAPQRPVQDRRRRRPLRLRQRRQLRPDRGVHDQRRCGGGDRRPYRADDQRPVGHGRGELAHGVGASEIVVESFAARATYTRVVREALARHRIDRTIRVTAWPPKGSGRGGGDAIARSSALLQGLEIGTCRLAGHFPELEEQAVNWQQGQHQPDALAALVVAHDVLVHTAGQQIVIAPPQFDVSLSGSRRPATVTPIHEGLRRRLDSRGGYDPFRGLPFTGQGR